MTRGRGKGRLHAQDHCQEEQLPLDLFSSSIETRSFIFPEIEIRLRSGLESRRSNVCSPYGAIFGIDVPGNVRSGMFLMSAGNAVMIRPVPLGASSLRHNDVTGKRKHGTVVSDVSNAYLFAGMTEFLHAKNCACFGAVLRLPLHVH